MRRIWMSVVFCLLAATVSVVAPDMLDVVLRAPAGEPAICLITAADRAAPAIPTPGHGHEFCALCRIGSAGLAPPPGPLAQALLVHPVVVASVTSSAYVAHASPRRAAHGPRAPPLFA